MSWSVVETGAGWRFFVRAENGALTSGALAGHAGPRYGEWPEDERNDRDALLREARLQIRAYFLRKLTEFTLPLNLGGTPFQRSVWDLLVKIPYGQTRCYLDLAIELGQPGAARAVGSANGANPLPVIVPCHRVIASSGGLGGYAYGLDLKQTLLDLEGAKTPPRQDRLFDRSAHSVRRFSR